MPPPRYRAFLFVEQNADAIRAGTFAVPAMIATEGGFAEAYVPLGQPGRDAWLTRFDAHVDTLWEDAKGHVRNNVIEITYGYWEFNQKYREQVLDGTFPEKGAIKTASGLTLPWSLLASTS